MSAALELRNVEVRYGGRRGATPVVAVRNVNLTVRRGERVAVVGRSGAGKSTLVRLATGLVKPTSGQVRSLGVGLDGISRRELRAVRTRMHLVFQDPYQSLHPGFSAHDAVAEPLVIRGVATKDQDDLVVHALAAVGLVPPEQFLDRVPSSLSGGQRQRVAIARALVAAPELLLADEPTSMLDASLRATVADLLLALQAADNAALVFITHDLALARHVSDRVVVMAGGEIVEDRPTEELLKAPAHPETRLLLGAARHDLSR